MRSCLRFTLKEKDPQILLDWGILVREAGLEPARPEWTLEPESSESANSTTRASYYLLSRDCSYILARGAAFVNCFFAVFSSFSDAVRKKSRACCRLRQYARGNMRKWETDGSNHSSAMIASAYWAAVAPSGRPVILTSQRSIAARSRSAASFLAMCRSISSAAFRMLAGLA